MSGSVWVPLLSALIGAIAAGLLQTISRWIDRKNEREATLAALAMEVRAICNLMRLRKYLPRAEELLHHMRENPELVSTIVADIREDYFSVFDALAPKLGLLRASDGAQIVEFYEICRSIKDSCRPDGIMSSNQDRDLAIGALEEFVELLRKALQVGDQVVQLPSFSLGQIAKQ